MKRLVMTVALATMFLTFGTFNANAQVPQEPETTMQQQEEFTSIKNNELPDKVKEAVKKDYNVENIETAYVNTDKSKYKMDLKIEGKDQGKTVVYDKDGEEVEQ